MSIDISFNDYKNRMFTRDLKVRRDPVSGPGWYVFASSVPGVGRDHYGGGVVKMIARPKVKPRKHPHYNVKVRRGWHTQAEALAAMAEVQKIIDRVDHVAASAVANGALDAVKGA